LIWLFDYLGSLPPEKIEKFVKNKLLESFKTFQKLKQDKT